ncbi:MAG: ABC transporter substrate-binding protein [Gemmatimonadaceae bacterium]|nr:ABC transporter substrate-binding protein [Gemmatimonadaceae bacterium]
MVTLPLRRAFTLLGCLAITACERQSRAGGGELRLGAAGAWETSYGAMAHRGIELAVEELNRQGGLDGRPVSVVFRDDQADGGLAADIAREFVDDPTIVGVIGHLSSTAMVAAARVYDGELAALSPSATSPDLSGVSRWLFRLNPSDSMTGRTLGEMARVQFAKRRVAVIYDNTSYGRGLVEPFLAGLAQAPVALEPIDPSGDSIDVNVAAIARQNPDLIFAVGTVSGPPVLKAIRAAGITVPVIAGDGWSGVETGMEVRDVMIALPFSSTEDRPDAQRFVAAFRSRYKVDPDAYAALSYDATIALARAAATGRTREGTRATLASMRDTRGYATGAVRFSTTGDPIGRRMHLLRIDGRTRTFGVMQ